MKHFDNWGYPYDSPEELVRRSAQFDPCRYENGQFVHGQDCICFIPRHTPGKIKATDICHCPDCKAHLRAFLS